MKHFTIPIFIPELACPNRCVFCNQHSISGFVKQPEPEEVREIILQHLKTIPEKDCHIEIGFFGGSFTGIEPALQEQYLSIAYEFLISGQIHGIRLSTRPDYINPEALSLLKRYGVTTIELGAQSLNDEVLLLSGRGHKVADVERASELILSSGFKLGLQMMTGLPGDTPQLSLQTARRIVELGASCTRIYPTLVIRGTELEQRWRSGEYQPQSLDEAVELAARLMDVFYYAGVEVIRVGLHPSEGLLDGSEMLAGPFHPSFRELVKTFIWKQKLIKLIDKYPQGGNIHIPAPQHELRYAIGYNSENRKMLENHFKKVEFFVEDLSPEVKPLIVTDKKLPLPAKNTLKSFANLLFLHSEKVVYKSIGGHPDIFMCQGSEGIVAAPSLPQEILVHLGYAGVQVVDGISDPGKTYPDSARYNAVVTADLIIHNLKITDPAIFKTFQGRKHLHVNQGYTRCNLLALDDNHFITSDHGIEKALLAEGKHVMFADPAPVKLKGQKYGFFPGCCGILNGEVLIAGSLTYHPEGEQIREFINVSGLTIRELNQGPLTDVGGIFCFVK
jgi:radical SAM superfamily enzyme